MLDGDTLEEDGAAPPSFRLDAEQEGRAEQPGFQSGDPDMAPEDKGELVMARHTSLQQGWLGAAKSRKHACVKPSWLSLAPWCIR